VSLYTICSAVASYIPVAVPSSIIGNSDETASLLLQCAQDEGEALARRPQGGWVNMIAEYDFTTVAIGPINGIATNGSNIITGFTTTAGIEPNTFYVFGPGCNNNTIVATVPDIHTVTLNQPIQGLGTSPSTGGYTFGQSDYALPVGFERAIDNTFWDRSRFWSMRGPLSPQQWQLFKSSVIGKASIQRRYRFRRIAGSTLFSVDPCPTDNDSALVFEYVSNAWCQSDVAVLQTQWMADTDTGVIDEYLMRLGVRYRMLRRLGLSYQEELSEYERQVDKAVAQDGAAAILNMTPENNLTLIGPWNLPETNYGGVIGT
jgi:hypothetical protein